MKRNHVVLIVLLAAIALMAWAGWANFERRKQDQERHNANQAVLLSTPPSADDVPDTTKFLLNKPAPAFTLEDLNGKKVSLSDFKGKAVVLDFWATWCAPCKVEIPWLLELRKQYGAQGLEIVGASTDELDFDDKANLAKDKADVAAFVQKMQIDYPILLNGQSVSKPYGGLDALPTTIFIDRKGVVVASEVGLNDKNSIEANIKKALGGA